MVVKKFIHILTLLSLVLFNARSAYAFPDAIDAYGRGSAIQPITTDPADDQDEGAGVGLPDQRTSNDGNEPLSQDTYTPLYVSPNLSSAPSFSELIYVEHKDGGTGGVDIYSDPEGKKWTFKAWKNKNHGVNENIGSEVFQVLGLHTPHLALYTNVPEAFRRDLPEASLFRLAEFMEGVPPTNQEARVALSQYYVPLAFMSSWDTKSDNLVLDKAGNTVFIDTGSVLLHHALGSRKQESKEWSAHKITEFETFSTETQSLLLRPNEHSFYESVSNILAQAPTILNVVDTLSRALKYADRLDLLNMLSSRLNHLKILADVKNGTLLPFAAPHAYAAPSDAAGELTWTVRNGQPHILLGKRSSLKGNNTWCNLGGSADPGETFVETASRETLEESGNLIVHSPLTLQNSSSHDLLSLNEAGVLSRFRTYLAYHTDIPDAALEDASTLSDGEYSTFSWIPVEDLMGASETGTLNVNDDEEELFPPFFESLQQPQVKGWLASLLENSLILNSSTQGLKQNPHNLGLTETAFFEPPFQRHHDFADHYFHFRDVLRDLRSPYPNQDDTIDLIENGDNNIPSSASHQALQRLFPGENDLYEKIKRAIFQATEWLDTSVSIEVPFMIHEIIENERFHPNKFVLYHGLKSEIWFCYRVLSHIRHLLDDSPLQTDVLRSFEAFFDDFPDATALQDYIIEGNTNYSVGFQRAGLSMNPSLFGNLQSPSSCTLRYFLEGYNSQSPKIWNIVGEVFNTLNISSNGLIEELQTIFTRHYSGTTGALLQVFLDEASLTKLAYIAGSSGKVIYYKEPEAVRSEAGEQAETPDDHAIVKDPVEILQGLKNGNIPPLSQTTDALQARLHANLANTPGEVIVFDYLNDGSSGKAADIDIEETLSSFLPKMLESLVRDNSVYKTTPVKAQRTARVVFNIPDHERKAVISPLQRAFDKNDLVLISSILSETPEAINETYTDPDTLETEHLSNTYVALLKKLEDDRRSLVAATTQSLIQEDMNREEIRNLLAEVVTVKSEHLSTFSATVISLIKNCEGHIDVSYLVGAIKSLINAVEGDDLESIVTLTTNIAKQQTTDGDIAFIFESVGDFIDIFNEKDQLVALELALKFLNDTTDYIAFLDILSAIPPLVDNESDESLSILQLAVGFADIEKDDSIMILEAIDSIETEVRELTIKATLNIIKEHPASDYTAFSICSMLERISGIELHFDEDDPQTIAKAANLLIKVWTGSNTNLILNAVATIPPERRDYTVNLTQELLKEEASGREIAEVIERVNSIVIDHENDNSSKILNFFNEDMSQFDISYILSKIVEIPEETRPHVIDAISQFIEEGIAKIDATNITSLLADVRTMLADIQETDQPLLIAAIKRLIPDGISIIGLNIILRSVGNIESPNRLVFTQQAASLIHEGMDEFEISEVLKHLGNNEEN